MKNTLKFTAYALPAHIWLPSQMLYPHEHRVHRQWTGWGGSGQKRVDLPLVPTSEVHGHMVKPYIQAPARWQGDTPSAFPGANILLFQPSVPRKVMMLRRALGKGKTVRVRRAISSNRVFFSKWLIRAPHPREAFKTLNT